MRTEKIHDPKETMTEIISDNEVNIRMNRKQHRRDKKRKNRYKRNQTKRKRRQRKLIKKREEWLKTLEMAYQVELPETCMNHLIIQIMNYQRLKRK